MKDRLTIGLKNENTPGKNYLDLNIEDMKDGDYASIITYKSKPDDNEETAPHTYKHRIDVH